MGGIDEKYVFVTHKECPVASGDCFVAGQCIEDCRLRKRDDRIQELEKRVKYLEGAVSRLMAGTAKF